MGQSSTESTATAKMGLLGHLLGGHIAPAKRHSLAHAAMARAREPLILLDRDLRVVAASRPYFRMFPQTLFASRAGLFCEPNPLPWNASALLPLQDAIASHTAIEDQEIELDIPAIGRHTVLLNAWPVSDYGQVAMLVELDDMTVRQDADSQRVSLLHQQKAFALEVHHRVANSLQIIASILRLKARSVQSEETRRHLRDVDHRLILVAKVQRQLCNSGAVGKIDIGPYLVSLCDDLATSMTTDESAVTIEASSSECAIGVDDAESFGLIVTELVINALKHGFPGGRKGRISVAFKVDGPNWQLSISDNGIGRSPESGAQKHIGLGTTLVQTLARNLKARVEVAANDPGSVTSIIHTADLLEWRPSAPSLP